MASWFTYIKCITHGSGILESTYILSNETNSKYSLSNTNLLTAFSKSSSKVEVYFFKRKLTNPSNTIDLSYFK